MSKAKKTVAWVAICTSCVAGAEGIRQNAYSDVTGIPTVCFGETKGVKLGDHYTLEQCKAMLGGRLLQFGAEVDHCTKEPLPPKRKAAMVDFAYNEGSDRYCKYIAPILNTGDLQGACDHLLKFNTAGGIVFPGLTKRREMERELCLAGSPLSTTVEGMVDTLDAVGAAGKWCFSPTGSVAGCDLIPKRSPVVDQLA